MSGSEYEVVVIGGGPAGVSVARSLAILGHRVALCGSSRRHAAVEGLSERAASALRAAGFAQALEAIGPSLPRRSSWNGVLVDAGREHLVDRRRFDEALLRDALGSGVACHDARCEGWHYGERGVRAHERRRDGAISLIEARFLIDARGRAASFDRDSGARGPATTALGRSWRRPAHSAPGSAVAAFDEGWCWLAAPQDGPMYAQIALASDSAAIRSRSTLAAGYEAVVERVAELREWLRGATPCSDVDARDATPLLGGRLATERSLRIGDAALAPDPLSGQGLFEAIATGLAAAPVVNTILRRPADADLAREFHLRRIEDAFWRLARVGRDFHRAEQRWSESPFWSARRAWPDDAPVRGDAAQATIAAVPVSEDGFIVRREAIVTADHPRGVWRLDGVELVPLLQLLRSHEGLRRDQIAAEWSASRGVAVSDVERALVWLQQRCFA
jgi:flavin-dependent dehydrogenase